MKKIIFIFSFFLPSLFFAQDAKDINTVIQKTVDLHALKQYYSEEEKAGDTPLIIINDDKIPNNVIIFKFDKRVKIMTTEELESFKSVYKGDLESIFIFEILDFNDDAATIKALFRKKDKVSIDVSMKKEGDNWIVLDSKAG